MVVTKGKISKISGENSLYLVKLFSLKDGNWDVIEQDDIIKSWGKDRTTLQNHISYKNTKKNEKSSSKKA